MAVEQPQAGVVDGHAQAEGISASYWPESEPDPISRAGRTLRRRRHLGKAKAQLENAGFKPLVRKYALGDPLVQIAGSPRTATKLPRLPEWARKTPHAFRIAAPPEDRTAPAESAHGLRIGALPQHPRVLPPRRGDVHDPGQSLHARLRILFGAQRLAAKQDMRLDPDEPANVARMAAEMKLRYVVITSVNRDDLAGRRLAPLRRDRARRCAARFPKRAWKC